MTHVHFAIRLKNCNQLKEIVYERKQYTLYAEQSGFRQKHSTNSFDIL